MDINFQHTHTHANTLAMEDRNDFTRSKYIQHHVYSPHTNNDKYLNKTKKTATSTIKSTERITLALQ